MASSTESSMVEQGSGYYYKFVSAPPAALFCYLCQLVARDPQLSVCCGTNFCKRCLEKRTSPEGGCPACNDTDVALTAFPNKMSDREIKKLVVFCLNNEKGCGWTDELAKLEDHVAVCEMQNVECSLSCGATLKRLKLYDHLKNECPCRQTICEHCYMTGEHHVIVGQHRDQCPKLPLSCPNDCGLTDIIRSEMDEHLKKCPLQKTICKYHNIGCKAMLTGEDQDEHDEACMKQHFQLVSNDLVIAKEELTDVKMRMSRAEQVTEQVRNELALTKEELTEAKLKASSAEQSLEKMADELSSTSEELVITKAKTGKAEQSTENMQKDFETKMVKIQEEFYQWKQVTCSVFFGILPTLDWQAKLMVSSMLLEQSNVVAPVIVRITNVSEKIKNDETFQSSAFYTHRFGYRVCLVVAANGMDEYKGVDVSVAISILSGPNDGKLSWPPKGKFTVTLMNQIKNNNHHFLTLSDRKFNTDPSGYVCKTFISHADLFAASSARDYHTTDMMYMQVEYTEKK